MQYLMTHKLLPFNHMKNRFFFFAFLLLISACNQTAEAPAEQAPYRIHGTVAHGEAGKAVVLSQFDPVSQKKTALDTALLSADGSYELSFDFEEPDLYELDVLKKQKLMLAIDKGQADITIHVDLEDKEAVEIIGSPDSEMLLAYDRFRQESNQRLIKPTYAAMREAKGDAAGEVEAVAAYGEASEAHRKELIDFTEKNIGTSVALYGTMLRWTGNNEVSRLGKLVNDFKAVHPDLKMTRVMEDKVARYKQVAIGAPAPALNLPDTSGQTRQLRQLLGEYTLLDFWASWCGPCLLQVPDLHDAYEAFHDKGFEIVSISVDKREKRWKDAIEKYDLHWPNLSDLKGWESEASKAYNVTFVPFNLLVDKEGTILAKNLHSKALREKLEGLMGE
jgi:peroxiredoxin